MATLKKKRTRTKKSVIESRKYFGKNKIELECTTCGRLVVNLNPDTAAVQCGLCVISTLAPPATKKVSNETPRPRGWHRRKYYKSPEGIVFRYGNRTDK